jgi:hypothetical protein
VERREKIDPINPRNILGSVNIDAVYSEKEPNAPRWDCLVGYLSEAPRACFVEFHEANRDSCITEVEVQTGMADGQIAGEPFPHPPLESVFSLDCLKRGARSKFCGFHEAGSNGQNGTVSD